MSQIQDALQKLQVDLDKVFPGVDVRPPDAQELQAQIVRLREELNQPTVSIAAGTQTYAVAQMRIYKQLADILKLWKRLVFPVLVDLEKQRLTTLAQMAKSLEIK